MTVYERMCRNDGWLARLYCRVHFACTTGRRAVMTAGVLILLRPIGWRLLFGLVRPR